MTSKPNSEKSKRDNLIDTSIPSAGRMYDYYLGGNHNFEVDRLAANQVIQLMPFLPKYSRLMRWSLSDVAQELTFRRGFDVLIDFASGLPTADHLHNYVPDGTVVIYSDYDPAVVQYAQQILGDKPNVYYFEADASRPEILLNRPDVQEILNGRRKVGVVFWGVSGFLPDDELKYAMNSLYEWVEPGSIMAFNAQTAGFNRDDPNVIEMLKIYASFGVKDNLRSIEIYRQIVQPWKMETDFISLLDWHGFNQTELSKEDISAFGPFGSGHGVYLRK